MKLELQYVNDSNGNTKAIQMPLSDWEKVLKKLKKYEQALRLKYDLEEAMEQVTTLRKSNEKPKTLNEFLDEL